MNQPETANTLSMSATLDPSRPPSRSNILPATEAATSSSESSSPIQQVPLLQPRAGTAGESDDDVQFIFSAPRRRKKKRRRIESSHFSTEGFQSRLEQKAESPNIESPTPSHPLRRGTTGMVRRLESCHMGDIEGNLATSVVRSGSLPSVTPTMGAGSDLRPISFNPQRASKPPMKFFPFAPFMSMPGRHEANLQPQDFPVAHNDRNMQPQNEGLRKRKLQEDTRESMPDPAPHAQIEQAPTEPSFSSQMEGIQIEPLDIFGESDVNPTSTNPNSSSLSTSPIPSFCWKPIPSPKNVQMRSSPPIVAKSSGSATMAQNTIGSQHTQTPSSVQPEAYSSSLKETVTVPARFVPEQSVSPRTQTVEIPRLSPPFPTQEEARQMMLWRRAVNSPSRGFAQNSQTSGSMLPLNPVGQFQIPRSVPPQSFPLPGFQRSQQIASVNRPQNPQTYPSDVQRKPSLYKVPPWPSPPSSTSPTHILSSAPPSPTSNMKVGNSNVCLTNSASGGTGLSHTQRTNMEHAQGLGGQVQSSTQRMMPVTPPETPPLQSPASSSLSSPPLQAQLISNKRKHSPNLIFDIAETCQSNFPFAAVAERHQVPIQKVFDTFSAIIQLPLLRSASDNRRHGSLGKRRIKEFRDAKKRMEMAMKEQEKEAESESGRGRKKNGKKGPEQPLLRAAILNARRG